MKKRRYLMVIILVVVYSLSFTASVLSNVAQAVIDIDKKYEQNVSEYYITIQHESIPFKLPNQEKTIKLFKDLHQTLKNSQLYIYYDIYNQPLYIPSEMEVNETEINTDSYDESFAERDTVSCLQISENVQYDFDFSLLSGRLLQEEDYSYNIGDDIPVLMGADFSSNHHLGEKFTAEYLFDSYSFEVVGFLEAANNINLLTNQWELDQIVLMPSFDFISYPQTEEGFISQTIHYANKTSGKLKFLPEDYEAVCDFLIPLLNTDDLGEYSWYTSSSYLNYLREGINLYSSIRLLNILFVVLILLALLTTFYYFRLFHINDPSSKNKAAIPGMVFHQIMPLFIVLLLANILSVLFSFFFLNEWGLKLYHYWGWYMSLAVIVGFTLLITVKTYREES